MTENSNDEKIKQEAKNLGLPEDGWYDSDGKFRAAAVKERILRVKQFSLNLSSAYQQKWIGAAANQATVFGGIIGFLGIILTVLFATGIFGLVEDLPGCIQIAFSILVLAGYVTIAISTLVLMRIVKNERAIAWQEMMGHAVDPEKKEAINKLHYHFESLFTASLILTFFVLAIVAVGRLIIG